MHTREWGGGRRGWRAIPPRWGWFFLGGGDFPRALP